MGLALLYCFTTRTYTHIYIYIYAFIFWNQIIHNSVKIFKSNIFLLSILTNYELFYSFTFYENIKMPVFGRKKGLKKEKNKSQGREPGISRRV